MARPRAADYEDKKQLIRDRAAELFAARGFAATSIAEIAAACKTAKSLVYHYFGAKDDILYDLLVEHVSRLLAEADAALAGVDDPRAQLRAFVRAHIRLYAGAWAKHRLLLNALGDLSEPRREEVKELERSLVARARALLVALNPALADRPAAATAATMSMYGLMNWSHTWYRADGPLVPDEYADLAADMILDGVGALGGTRAGTKD